MLVCGVSTLSPTSRTIRGLICTRNPGLPISPFEDFHVFMSNSNVLMIVRCSDVTYLYSKTVLRLGHRCADDNKDRGPLYAICECERQLPLLSEQCRHLTPSPRRGQSRALKPETRARVAGPPSSQSKELDTFSRVFDMSKISQWQKEVLRWRVA